MPLACQNVEEEHQSYRVKIGKGGFATEEDLSLDTILTLTRPLPTGHRAQALRDGYIQLCADAEGEVPLSSRVKGHLWISADIALEDHRYFLHEGKWYEIGATHLETIRSQVEGLLSGAASVSLPRWDPRFTREDEYNEDAVNHGFVVLDKKELHTTQHPHGIEACDLLGTNGEFIHVKAPTGSSELSHLFHQALTSYDALRYDTEARQKLSDRVRAARPGVTVPAQPKIVIFAVALKRKVKGQPATYRPLTVDTLFTFSQVSLVHTVRMFELAHVKVEVADISPRA